MSHLQNCPTFLNLIFLLNQVRQDDSDDDEDSDSIDNDNEIRVVGKRRKGKHSRHIVFFDLVTAQCLSALDDFQPIISIQVIFEAYCDQVEYL